MNATRAMARSPQSMTTGLAALSYSVLRLLLKAELDMTALR